MKPYLLIYYNGSSSTGLTARFQECVIDGAKGGAGKIGTCELLLNNDDGALSEGGGSEIEAGKMLEIRAGWQYDEFKEWDAPGYNANGTAKASIERNQWPFRGTIIEVIPDGKSTRIVAEDLGHIAARRYPECMTSYRTNYTPLKFLKGATNTDETFPAPAESDAITYLDADNLMFPASFPTSGNASALALDVSGVVNVGSYINYTFSAINGVWSESLFANIRNLADGLGYLSEWRYWRHTDGDDYPRLFVWPKYCYLKDKWDSGDNSNAATIAAFWAVLAAGEGTTWEKKHSFTKQDDNPMGSWSKIAFQGNAIKQTTRRQVDRVIVRGNTDLGIVAVSGVESGVLVEAVVSNPQISSDNHAQMIADIQRERNSDQTYEGKLTAYLNWRVQPGDVVKVNDSGVGWNDGLGTATYHQVRNVRHVMKMAEEWTTEIEVGTTFTVLDVADNLSKRQFEVRSMAMFLPADQVPVCIQRASDTATLTDTAQYGIKAAVCDTPALHPDSGKLTLEWTKATLQWDANFTSLGTFTKYLIYVKAGLLVTPTGYDFVWDETDDANLANINTVTTTLTGLTPAGVYSFLLMSRVSVGGITYTLEGNMVSGVAGS